MAITVFQTNAETILANMAADLLVTDATFDDGASNNENAQLLVVMWALVKAIKARQHAAPTTRTGSNRDRVLEMVGGVTAQSFMALITNIDVVYKEFYVLFNSNDENLSGDSDEIWGTNLLTRGTGPQNGPLMGSPNFTADKL